MSSTATTRTPLPEGTLPVAGALLIAGIATYAFFKIGTWAVGGEDAVQPDLVAVVRHVRAGPGLLHPARAGARPGPLPPPGRRRRAASRSSPRIVRLGLILVAARRRRDPVPQPADRQQLLRRRLGHARGARSSASPPTRPAHVARGICSGSGRFRSYAIVLGTDGVVRIVLCVALAVVGVSATGPVRLRRRPRPARRRRLRVLAAAACAPHPAPRRRGARSRRTSAGCCSARCSAPPLLNAGPIATTLLADDERQGAGHPVRLRRAAGPHPAVHVPGRAGGAAARGSAGWRPRASSTSSGPGSSACCCVVLGVGVVGTLGALVLGPFVDRRSSTAPTT